MGIQIQVHRACIQPIHIGQHRDLLHLQRPLHRRLPIRLCKVLDTPGSRQRRTLSAGKLQRLQQRHVPTQLRLQVQRRLRLFLLGHLRPQVLQIDRHPIAIVRRNVMPLGTQLPRRDELTDREILHPFARGARKSLTPEEIFEFSRLLVPIPVIVVGRTDVNFATDQNGISLVNQTDLPELIWLLRRASFIVSVDSGPMHIAAAVRTPLLALFGSTSDIATGPYLFGKVIHKHVSCSPCYLRTCPIDFRCMKRIEVDEVVYELKKMLEDSA